MSDDSKGREESDETTPTPGEAATAVFDLMRGKSTKRDARVFRWLFGLAAAQLVATVSCPNTKGIEKRLDTIESSAAARDATIEKLAGNVDTITRVLVGVEPGQRHVQTASAPASTPVNP